MKGGKYMNKNLTEKIYNDMTTLLKEKKSNKLNSFTNYSRKIQGSGLSSLYSYS